MKNRIAITLALTALVVGVLASASIGQTATKGGSAQLSAPGGGWQDVAPLPQTLFGPATATDGTYVYAIGGYHFPEAVGSTLNTVYRYTPGTNTWTTMAPMPQPSLIASAVYYPPTNKIYVFGGATRTPDPVVIYDTTLIYDIATNAWSAGATMPAPRYQMAAGYNPADGKIYLNGGFEETTIDTVQDTTWRYDPAANSFTELDPESHRAGRHGVGDHQWPPPGRRRSNEPGRDAGHEPGTTTSRPIRGLRRQDMPQPTNVPGSAVAQGRLWAMGGCTPTPCNPVPRDVRRPSLRSRRERVVGRSRASITRDRSQGVRRSATRCTPWAAATA